MVQMLFKSMSQKEYLKLHLIFIMKMCMM